MEESARKKIIVPWDFREESQYPLLHAYQLAQVRGDDIVLLTTIERPGIFGSKEKFTNQHIELQRRIEEEAARYNAKLRAEFGASAAPAAPIVTHPDFPDVPLSAARAIEQVEIIGEVLSYDNLRNDFRDYYYTHDANLVVTRQFVTPLGAKKEDDMIEFLLRVKSSRQEGIPFIIANNAPTHKYYTDLVVPVTPNRTFKETVRWIIQISSYYHCNVNLIRPPALNDAMQKFNLSTNINFAKKYFEELDIIYGLKTGNRKAKFEDSVFEFMQMIDADLLILMSDQFSSYFPNKRMDIDTPVMFINPILKKLQSFN